MVYKAGVGVKPVPVTQLTKGKLAHAFRELRKDKMKAAAQQMARQFGKEDGAKEGTSVAPRPGFLVMLVKSLLDWEY
jgi:UDP:flavonoid glycosyltransferase YjiC (YdhE family)